MYLQHDYPVIYRTVTEAVLKLHKELKNSLPAINRTVTEAVLKHVIHGNSGEQLEIEQ